jgi:DNA polymerase
VTLEIDFETRSAVDLRKRGAHNYFADPSTVPLMASYRIDGGPVRRWRPPAPCPADIRAHVEAGGMISAHNASFERQLWQMVLTPRYGWPAVRLEQFRCTAATAAALGLPRSLGDLGAALGLQVQKDKAGTTLIRKFSLPRPFRKGDLPGLVYYNDPAGEDFERFHDYCDRDVLTEAEADRRMVPLSAEEQAVYTLSERINDRGIRIDLESAHAALALAEKAKTGLDAEMRAATGGFVQNCTQVAKIVEWLRMQGVEVESAAKADIVDLLERKDLDPGARRVLELRQEAAKTSVSKLKAMVARASDDGRVRGSFLFCGASTGRWSNVGVNFANLPRPRREFDEAHLDRETLFRAIRTADPDTLRFLYGDDLGRPLHLLSDAIRGFIWAAPRHDLVQADYSGIEGAVAAWVAGEGWKVQALHEIIADPSLPDLYRRAAASIMNTTTDVVTKKHPLRQSVGKVSELALGFGGGVSAFVSMARNYGVDLDALYGPVWEAADPERRDKAERRYGSALKRKAYQTDVLSREAWIACEIIKVGWRAAHPAIKAAWGALETAMRDAIRNPGVKVPVLKGVTYLYAKGFLWCRLPSGRVLAYGAPKLTDQVWARYWLAVGEWSDPEVMDRAVAEKLEIEWKVKIEGETSPRVSALGVNSATRKMERYGLYGGLAFENIVQAIARDLLVNGMWKAEGAGYPIIAHVYDEIIAEVPRGYGDLAAFEKLICELPAWAAGMPLTAGGWRGKRYRKD